MSDDPTDPADEPVDAAATDAATEAPVDAAPPADDPAVAALTERVAVLTNQLARTRAELQNVLRDRSRDAAEAAERAQVPLLKVLGDVLDDLDRAMEAAQADPQIQVGIELVRRRVTVAFETHGITVDDPLGQPFDPRRHEAVIREETDDHADGSVIEVLQPGLVAEGRIIRPALVKVAVARKVAKPAAPDDTDEVEGSGNK